MTDSQQRWVEVAAEVNARMDFLGYGISDLAKTSGVSRETLRPLLAGENENPRRSTLTRVCKGLGWTPHSIDLILDGQSPISVETVDKRQPLLFHKTGQAPEAISHRAAVAMILDIADGLPVEDQADFLKGVATAMNDAVERAGEAGSKAITAGIEDHAYTAESGEDPGPRIEGA